MADKEYAKRKRAAERLTERVAGNEGSSPATAAAPETEAAATAVAEAPAPAEEKPRAFGRDTLLPAGSEPATAAAPETNATATAVAEAPAPAEEKPRAFGRDTLLPPGQLGLGMSNAPEWSESNAYTSDEPHAQARADVNRSNESRPAAQRSTADRLAQQAERDFPRYRGFLRRLHQLTDAEFDELTTIATRLLRPTDQIDRDSRILSNAESYLASHKSTGGSSNDRNTADDALREAKKRYDEGVKKLQEELRTFTVAAQDADARWKQHMAYRSNFVELLHQHPKLLEHLKLHG
jgi:hypothetical protein